MLAGCARIACAGGCPDVGGGGGCACAAAADGARLSRLNVARSAHDYDCGGAGGR